jgi:hypothetical protein
MTGKAKRRILILLGLVTFITTMIAASLPRLELQPGMPLPLIENSQVVAAESIENGPLVVISVNEFVIALFVLIVAGSFLYVMYKLLKGADWKFLKSFIPAMLMFSLVVVGIMFLIMLLPRSNASVPPVLPMPTPAPLVSAPLGSVPPLLIWLVGIGLLVTLVIGVWVFTSSARQPSTIDAVGLEAEKAWQALKTGLDLKVVILQCYRQMSLVLEKEQGVERKDFMTTGEFKNVLEAAGVPHEPIHQLTRLFEAVRYGNWRPNSLDEQKAIQCLEAIMLFSREAKEAGVK